jgi:hypothetical protein
MPACDSHTDDYWYPWQSSLLQLGTYRTLSIELTDSTTHTANINI